MPDLENYYISESDLRSKITSSELAAITEEVDTSTQETNVQSVIKAICGMADSYLQSKYDIPLAESYVTDSLKDALGDIVVWKLAGLYASISAEVKDIRKENFRNAMQYLMDLSTGKAKIDPGVDSSGDPIDTTEADKYYAEDGSRERLTDDIH